MTLVGAFSAMGVMFALLALIFSLISNSYHDREWTIAAITSLVVAVGSFLSAIWLAVAGLREEEHNGST